MYILLRLVLNALALLIVSYLTPGIFFSSTWALIIAALVFGLINAIIRPLIVILTLPVNILTLGLFTLVINALMLWLTSSIVKGFEVSSFASAFWGALIYWIIILLINYLWKGHNRYSI